MTSAMQGMTGKDPSHRLGPCPATLVSSLLSGALLVATLEPPDPLLAARGEQQFEG
jgi:hypothetical protein